MINDLIRVGETRSSKASHGQAHTPRIQRSLTSTVSLLQVHTDTVSNTFEETEFQICVEIRISKRDDVNLQSDALTLDISGLDNSLRTCTRLERILRFSRERTIIKSRFETVIIHLLTPIRLEGPKCCG